MLTKANISARRVKGTDASLRFAAAEWELLAAWEESAAEVVPVDFAAELAPLSQSFEPSQLLESPEDLLGQMTR